MNPPSALHGAMSKERKPFTYTPGGLDLSEIKSERMAQRLMRNAMNQGVPEKPVHTLQSPPAIPSNAIPNFNCLPVQVFPSFNLPANPKSLLRSRSNPDGPKEQSNNVSKFNVDNSSNVSIYKGVNSPPTFTINNSLNNNKQFDTYVFKSKPNENSFYLPPDYENDTNKCIIPKKQLNSDLQYSTMQTKQAKDIVSVGRNYMYTTNLLSDEESRNESKKDILFDMSENNKTISELLQTSPLQEKADSDNEKKEVKVVKKKINTENEVEHDGDTEAEVVIKLPSKKSAAKTETSVDILKKKLPDGTVEEVKTTTTKTTIDGRTEITTKTEKTRIPKDDDDSEEVEEEQEEEVEEVIQANGQEEESNNKIEQSVQKNEEVNDEESQKLSKQQNGHIIISEEKTEKNTVKKVVVSQLPEAESEEEEEIEEVEELEEEEEGEPDDVGVEEVVILKKVSTPQSNESKVEDENEVLIQEDNKEEVRDQEIEDKEDIVENEEIVEEEELENEEDHANQDGEVEKEDGNQDIKESEDNIESEPLLVQNEEEDDEKKDKKVEETKDEIKENKKASESESVDVTNAKVDVSTDEVQNNNLNSSEVQQNGTDENVPLNDLSSKSLESKNEKHERKEEIIIKTSLEYEPKVGFLREPSVPLEKVEDVEIKPIGPAQEIFKKSHTEIITTTTDKPIGASTQTEFNRIENIVTVNRTSKILDHAYEQIPQLTEPTLNTYFTQASDKVLSTPQPLTRPYQPIYQSEPQTERRHSLLLERLSMERQIPTSDINQNQSYQSSQNREQSPWLQEPQSEVLTVSNVKPSEITKNQQWYQNTRKDEVISSTFTPAMSTPIPQWNKPQTQQFIQSQPQAQPQGQPQYQPFAQPQPQQSLKPEFTPSFTENVTHNKFNNYQNNTYTSYTPKPSWVSSTFESKPSIVSQSDQYSTIKKESKESYQSSSQQLSSSYVPPPWEQDSSYVSNNTNYYQPPPPVGVVTSYAPPVNSSWQPKPASKFSKPAPTSYVPPAPNQSFVKPVSSNDPLRLPGRKTYYSEYERRYISVPESTYVPVESKFQAQPDPSPQYYYDNNEPAETVEPQWRRELREFTEKSQTTQAETTSVKPPWEEDAKYASSADYSEPAPTTWTQTLRPRSFRERSFEPEYAGSKEWPRSNTLGRGRPLSSYIRSNVDSLPRPPRGVSVDRYNPNSYMSPAEHPPVQSHTMNPSIHPKPLHNPNIPAYQARASAEPREQPAYIQPRIHVDSRAPPVQSRSFKYLQWITGTED